ncbi:AEC family transporter [Marinilactibacillus psychrotolerans]|uniref:AEC family transporter n=1 Tax=Marinilactibacillus psychrotolerans TaxID=191770 RepID=UPI00211AB251|nr:AEC family transporter [Marinilactibacillus psychrotolerans]
MLEQLAIMFFVAIFGFLLVRLKVLDMYGSQQIANMTTRFVIPIVLMMSFQQEYNSKHLSLLTFALVGSFLIMITRILMVSFLLKSGTKIDRFAVVFSNTALVGIPIVLPLLGYEGIFYLSMYIVASGIFQFTYGIWLLSEGKQTVTLRQALANPATIGAFAGLVLYLLRINLPSVIYNGFDKIADISSPLGMILLGGYLARTNLKDIFLVKKNYWTVLVRLILTPLVGLIMIWLLPIQNESVLLVLSIANCTPTAVNTAMFSQIYGGDYEYGARLIVLASILAMISMPIMITLSNFILSIN